MRGPEFVEDIHRTEFAEICRIAFSEDFRDSRLVVVEGHPGLGRTVLLWRAVDEAHARGWTVLTAGDLPDSRAAQFGVARALFDEAVRDAAPGVRRQLLTGAAAPARRVLGLSRRPAADAPVDVDGGCRALYQLTVRLAARAPVLLAIDDFDLVDDATVRWLGYLARRMRSHPIAVVLTGTPARLRPHPGPLADLGHVAHRIRLRGLDRSGTKSLAAGQLGEATAAELAVALRTATDGIPLLIKELARVIAEQPGTSPLPDAVAEFGSPELGQAILDWLGRIAPAMVTMVRLAGVAGPLDFELAAWAAGAEPRRAWTDAHELVRAGLLRQADPVELHVPFVRRSVAARLGQAERDELLLRVAAGLRERHASSRQIVGYLLPIATRTGLAWVAETLREAAATALLSGDYPDASDYLRRLRTEVTVSQQHLDEHGSVPLHGDLAQSAHRLTALLADATGQQQVSNLTIWLSGALIEIGGGAEAVAVLDEAIGLGSVTDRALLADLVSFRSSVTAWLSPALATSPEPAPAASPAGGALRASLSGDTSTAIRRSALRVLDDLPERAGHGEYRLAADVLSAGLALLHTESLEHLLASCDVQLTRAKRDVRPLLISLCYALRALAETELGNDERGLSGARASLAVLDADHDAGPRATTMIATAALIRSLAATGQIDQADDMLARYRLAGAVPEALTGVPLLYGRGLVRLAAGEPDAALAEFRVVEQRLRQWRAGNLAAVGWRSAAAVALAMRGWDEPAVRLAAEEVRLARDQRRPRALGRALAVTGLLRARQDGRTDGTPPAELTEAIELLATLSPGNGDQPGAPPTERALALLGHRGGAVLAQRLAALSTPPAVRLLSPRELQLIDLALAGQTNGAIAAQFSVSRRAIEYHFTQIYRKLGISGRMQLADRIRTLER